MGTTGRWHPERRESELELKNAKPAADSPLEASRVVHDHANALHARTTTS